MKREADYVFASRLKHFGPGPGRWKQARPGIKRFHFKINIVLFQSDGNLRFFLDILIMIWYI